VHFWQRILALDSGGGVWLTRDNGEAWDKVHTPDDDSSHGRVTSIVLHPYHDGCVRIVIVWPSPSRFLLMGVTCAVQALLLVATGGVLITWTAGESFTLLRGSTSDSAPSATVPPALANPLEPYLWDNAVPLAFHRAQPDWFVLLAEDCTVGCHGVVRGAGCRAAAHSNN
jgi:hypothetical protein